LIFNERSEYKNVTLLNVLRTIFALQKLFNRVYKNILASLVILIKKALRLCLIITHLILCVNKKFGRGPETLALWGVVISFGGTHPPEDFYSGPEPLGVAHNNPYSLSPQVPPLQGLLAGWSYMAPS